jgi:2-keto-4-pentenoate hydratase/2-oxohepta-3-ene-1,7-dioic acid hydratase in catechol pathway
VARPDGITTFDYEPEVVFVIGKPTYKATYENALEHVFGMTLFNDLTAREIQKREVRSGTRFWTSKNMPGFGPLGPWVVTLDEVGDINDLDIECHVNGERRMRYNTCDQINKLADVVVHFSKYMPLHPGDLFAMGSAGGVAVGQPNAEELFLKPGDTVDVVLEGVMTLSTDIIEE